MSGTEKGKVAIQNVSIPLTQEESGGFGVTSTARSIADFNGTLEFGTLTY